MIEDVDRFNNIKWFKMQIYSEFIQPFSQIYTNRKLPGIHTVTSGDWNFWFRICDHVRMIASHGCTSSEFSIYLNKIYMLIYTFVYAAIEWPFAIPFCRVCTILTHGTSSMITTILTHSLRASSTPRPWGILLPPNLSQDEDHAAYFSDLVTRRSKPVVDQHTAGFKRSFRISPMRCGRRILNALAVEQE